MSLPCALVSNFESPQSSFVGFINTCYFVLFTIAVRLLHSLYLWCPHTWGNRWKGVKGSALLPRLLARKPYLGISLVSRNTMFLGLCARTL